MAAYGKRWQITAVGALLLAVSAALYGAERERAPRSESRPAAEPRQEAPASRPQSAPARTEAPKAAPAPQASRPAPTASRSEPRSAAPRQTVTSRTETSGRTQSAYSGSSPRQTSPAVSSPAPAPRVSQSRTRVVSRPRTVEVSSRESAGGSRTVTSTRSTSVSSGRSTSVGSSSSSTQGSRVASADVNSNYKPAAPSRESITVTRSASGAVKDTAPAVAADKSAAAGGRESIRTVETKSRVEASKEAAAPTIAGKESSDRSRSVAPARTEVSKDTSSRDRSAVSREISTGQRATAARPDSKEAAAGSRTVSRDSTDRMRTAPDKSITRSEVTAERGALREESARRARAAGTERISARPSEAYRNKPIVAASESRIRTTTVPENTSQIVINGNNNVIVQGDVTIEHPRPYIAPRLYGHSVFYPHRHDHWYDHGLYFSFAWSSSSCGRVVWAPYHSHWGFSYYYPRYHRKYVFVSLGGCWPSSYRYRRYYWYGCHPGYWYGTHIIEQPVVQNTTYNTYNYYGTGGTTTVASTNVYDNPPLTQTTDVVDVIDAPTDESVVDICFAHGVKVFGDGNYAEAVERFRRAVQMDPQDVILPFTYSQALFANCDYALSAGVLRAAIQNIPEDELTIYYPRGLYENEAVLSEQIQHLESAIAAEPFDADYQLLLGYQYLGLGELEKARGPLTEAGRDIANQFTAGKLLELADRLEAQQAEIEK